MVDIGIGTVAARTVDRVNERELNLAHTRLVIDDAIAHAKRALTAAECNQVPQPTQDAIFIALTRLQSAKAACKE